MLDQVALVAQRFSRPLRARLPRGQGVLEGDAARVVLAQRAREKGVT